MFKKIVTSLLVLTLQFSASPIYANSHANSLKNLGMNEIMFAQGMIPHHEQAIELSQLALKISINIEIKNLANSIIKAQSLEIKQMKYWISVNNASMDMGHDMGMTGMLSKSEISQLSKLKGKNFDKSFLNSMIKHHKGALEMISLISNSNNVEVKKLATSIKADQSREISHMKKLLANLKK